MLPLNRAIDHTLLRPEATREEVRRLLDEAAEHSFASVCVPPVYVAMAAERLRGTEVRTGTVVGFPLGYVHPEARLAESLLAISDGAEELDTAVDLSRLKSGEDDAVLEDLAAWVEGSRAARPGVTLKVILETALLSEDEKRRGALLAARAGADFVKTSTGFAKGGATVEDVAFLASVLAGRAAIKASGGIRDASTARALLAAGATRLGTSSGVAILRPDRRIERVLALNTSARTPP